MHDTRIARQVLRPEVLGPLRAGFRLDWHGIHGLPHWARVLRYGLAIASREGADPWVVAWFAVLHDHQRNDEGPDRGHGPRAADALASIAERGWLDGLDAGQRDRLAEAIRHHSEGWTHPDPSIGTCWDADRLDLARLGIATAPELLSTRTARRMVDPEAWGGIAPMRTRLARLANGGIGAPPRPALRERSLDELSPEEQEQLRQADAFTGRRHCLTPLIRLMFVPDEASLDEASRAPLRRKRRGSSP